MNHVVIFAGGVGVRMHSPNNVPKQFLLIKDKPIIVYTIEKFQNNKDVDNIVVVCVSGWIDVLQQYISKYNLTKVSKIIEGGQTGFDSRMIGLEYLVNNYNGEDYVILHDGVRPIITDELISDNFNIAKEKGNAITISKATETVVLLNKDSSIKDIPNRELCAFIRAPQTFKVDQIYKAYKFAEQTDRKDLIDSASVLRYYGEELHTVVCEDSNIKVTTQFDFLMIQGLLNNN